MYINTKWKINEHVLYNIWKKLNALFCQRVNKPWRGRLREYIYIYIFFCCIFFCVSTNNFRSFRDCVLAKLPYSSFFSYTYCVYKGDERGIVGGGNKNVSKFCLSTNRCVFTEVPTISRVKKRNETLRTTKTGPFPGKKCPSVVKRASRGTNQR